MKNRLLLNLLLLISITFSCNTKEYKIDNLGINFQFSNNIILIESKILSSDWEKLKNEWDGKYILSVKNIPFKDYGPFIRRTDKTEQELIEETYNKFKTGKQQVFKNGPLNKAYINYYSFFKYKNNIIGEKFFFMFDNQSDLWPESSSLDIQVPEKYFMSLTLIKNNNIINIELTYYDLNMRIPEKYPEYFKKDNNIWVYKDKNTPSKIYDLIVQKSKDAPKELVKLFEYFDEIEKSIVLK